MAPISLQLEDYIETPFAVHKYKYFCSPLTLKYQLSAVSVFKIVRLNLAVPKLSIVSGKLPDLMLNWKHSSQ